MFMLMSVSIATDSNACSAKRKTTEKLNLLWNEQLEVCKSEEQEVYFYTLVFPSRCSNPRVAFMQRGSMSFQEYLLTLIWKLLFSTDFSKHVLCVKAVETKKMVRILATLCGCHFKKKSFDSNYMWLCWHASPCYINEPLMTLTFLILSFFPRYLNLFSFHRLWS